MKPGVQFLLLQVRDPTDPMREQEVRCFAAALQCEASQIMIHDLLSGRPSTQQLRQADIVLVGGSGNYSVVTGGPWLEDALATMRELVEQDFPTFASCWGFQALCLALGGSVVTDVSLAEIGTHDLQVTAEGATDPLFAKLLPVFAAQMGHQDIVTVLPEQAVLLASTSQVKNQAIRIRGKRIYGTQFHPELSLACLTERLYAYPQYVESVAGVSIDKFVATCRPAPQSQQMLPWFVEWVLN